MPVKNLKYALNSFAIALVIGLTYEELQGAIDPIFVVISSAIAVCAAIGICFLISFIVDYIRSIIAR